MTNDYLTDHQSITELLFIDFIYVIDKLRLDQLRQLMNYVAESFHNQ